MCLGIYILYCSNSEDGNIAFVVEIMPKEVRGVLVGALSVLEAVGKDHRTHI